MAYSYLYVRRHPSYDLVNACKLGKADNIPDRESTYLTGEVKRGQFVLVLELPKDKAAIIEKMLQNYFAALGYHVRYDGGTEFYNIDIIPLIVPYMENLAINFRILSDSEINKLTRAARLRKETQKKLLELLKIMRLKRTGKKALTRWFERDYQKAIIEQGTEALQKLSRYYLELATGGGKSYCVYKILANIAPKCVVIFTPRTNINEQNVSPKYLSLLNDEYLPVLVSKESNFAEKCENIYRDGKRVVLVACINSVDRVYEWMKHSKNSSGSFIWFDEAHYGVEGWMENKKRSVSQDFMLRDSQTVKWRMFTSASPEKDEAKRREFYEPITGPLYTPIKVSELIRQKWLSPILAHIFAIDANGVDIVNYNLKHFQKFEAKHGFSFHNRRDHAYEVFKIHYHMFQRGITSIKPFLLLGKDYQIPDGLSLLEDITDISEFQNTPNSMGYVVQMYSMGYDFNKLDFILFADPKLSPSDIIQCIGRGTRPDGIGKNGSNLHKTLKIMLPVFFQDFETNSYHRIAAVLRYLVYNINFKFKDINMNFENSGTKTSKGVVIGEEEVQGILFDLLEKGKYCVWKENKFVEYLHTHKVHTWDDYKILRETVPEQNLPEFPFSAFPDFCWEETYQSESPYYTKTECIKKIREIQESDAWEELDDDDEEKQEFLHSCDPKIPPQCLFRFYGGINNNEYY